ncbi:hypothetical protein [Methermicoccus shengliensis]|uniref:DUF8060 domain-containing protein n=1 Tax=Methermicoccus shengliensis TaxID=660064 RepID=A0A832RS77_9EURY|nr:hypothetical protein [Methermicoccus shengliensis]KUK05146.1 MAG: hypothetical protein XD46_0139 [Euryarchaeota archaeon 55_53]KUK30712.1 MAG: hypothetical protein XD62_0221 [Methanosarcinales archeaon 56_1174]MDI3487306.1 hypothetical protein [Methanosarcinales archaeon]MDN5294620.1 hypothetical protein [Methanosarcinales archaeon]HIH69328.1 hypothetical protein [Methermicoccus shengliensis]
MEETKMKKFELEDVLKKIFIALSVILLIFSVWGLYSSLNELIRIWIGYKYAPIYRTLLNLAILILAIYVLNLLAKGKKS